MSHVITAVITAATCGILVLLWNFRSRKLPRYCPHNWYEDGDPVTVRTMCRQIWMGCKNRLCDQHCASTGCLCRTITNP